MKKIKISVFIICALLLASCSSTALVVDMSKGKESSCFDALRDEAKTLTLDVVQKGETHTYVFEGVYLKELLESENIKSYSKIELTVSDMDEPVDITEFANGEAGVFLAWSESDTDETPMRVFPADAATGNLLTRNVTAVVVTK
jgi:hypothetical protein